MTNPKQGFFNTKTRLGRGFHCCAAAVDDGGDDGDDDDDHIAVVIQVSVIVSEPWTTSQSVTIPSHGTILRKLQ